MKSLAPSSMCEHLANFFRLTPLFASHLAMWVLLLVLTMLVMIYFRTKRRSFIPSLPTSPGFTLPFIGGHSITLIRNGGDICQALREDWSGGPISYFNLLGPKVLINDPKLQLEVLNGKNFTKGGNGNAFTEVFGNGLAAQINVEMHARQVNARSFLITWNSSILTNHFTRGPFCDRFSSNRALMPKSN